MTAKLQTSTQTANEKVGRVFKIVRRRLASRATRRLTLEVLPTTNITPRIQLMGYKRCELSVEVCRFDPGVESNRLVALVQISTLR